MSGHTKKRTIYSGKGERIEIRRDGLKRGKFSTGDKVEEFVYKVCEGGSQGVETRTRKTRQKNSGTGESGDRRVRGQKSEET